MQLPGTLDGMEPVVKQDKRPPRIVRVSWGRMEVGRAWDWPETGTRCHSPGIQPADVDELVAHGATTVVPSRGMNKQLHVPPDACLTSKSGPPRESWRL